MWQHGLLALLHTLTYSQAAQKSNDLGGLAGNNNDISIGIDLAINKPSNLATIRHHPEKCKHGKWTQWGAWSKCSESCGPGKTTRKRKCKKDGETIGKGIEKMDCNEGSCNDDGCNGNPCENGGTCFPALNKERVHCECTDDFSGLFCQHKITNTCRARFDQAKLRCFTYEDDCKRLYRADPKYPPDCKCKCQRLHRSI